MGGEGQWSSMARREAVTVEPKWVVINEDDGLAVARVWAPARDAETGPPRWARPEELEPGCRQQVDELPARGDLAVAQLMGVWSASA
jgi:hypothetical protein